MAFLRSVAGVIYFVAMFIGATTVFLVAHFPAANFLGALTLFLLILGYGIDRQPLFGRANEYVQTTILSLTTLLLMVPTVSETLRRVPNGNPLVTDPKSPVLAVASLLLLLIFAVGLTFQILHLRKQRV